MKLILASRSQRRKEILSNLGYDFIVEPSDKEEIFDQSTIDGSLKKVALCKAQDVFFKHLDSCVLGADTIVVYQNKVLGKPRSKIEAFQTLRMLSGSVHEVKTAVSLCRKGREVVELETTKVYFRELTDAQIQAYVDSGRCMDKAGSYGIQEVDFVSKIEGSYSNVVGFPEDLVLKLLENENELRINEVQFDN